MLWGFTLREVGVTRRRTGVALLAKVNEAWVSHSRRGQEVLHPETRMHCLKLAGRQEVH